MGFFNRGRMQQAQSEGLDIFRAIARRAYQEGDLDASAEDLRDLAAGVVCQVVPRWTLEEKTGTLCRDGIAIVRLCEHGTAADLIAAVVGSELQVRFSDLSRRDRIKVAEAVAQQSQLWLAQLQESQLQLHVHSYLNPTASNPAHAELLAEACQELRTLAEQLLSSGHAASAMGQAMFGESKLRPLTALRMFVEKNPDWTLYDGELKLGDRQVGRFSNEDELNPILLKMAQAVVERDYSELNSQDRQAAYTCAIAAWDTAIDRISR